MEELGKKMSVYRRSYKYYNNISNCLLLSKFLFSAFSLSAFLLLQLPSLSPGTVVIEIIEKHLSIADRKAEYGTIYDFYTELLSLLKCGELSIEEITKLYSRTWTCPSMSSRIHKLDENVVNRIAAGEVIQRPANALKELLENSLDAGASSVQVTTKDGGLKLLQIQDNGCGIAKEDLEIVCERFTTSKLTKFEDLESIGTFGFRGEALASVSHVAHLTLVTKTQDGHCAFRASYSDGKLTAPPAPTASTQGTTLLVEDLFYNVPSRRKMFKSNSEEHSKIADVVSKYAIHNPKVAFSLKKHGEIQHDLKTPVGSTVLDNIRIVYGGQVARELAEFSLVDDKYDFSVSGYVSQPNYSSKKFVFLLFINHRLVECNPLKKAIEMVYTRLLPKGNHPFVYTSLSLRPQTVDVNVHPTKHEVRFLNEDSIVERIQREVESTLLTHNSSRTFVTQALAPCITQPLLTSVEPKEKESKRVYDHQLVRTDSKLQKLDRFLEPVKKSLEPPSAVEVVAMDVDAPAVEMDSCVENSAASTSGAASALTKDKKKRREITLSSVLDLRNECEKSSTEGLQELIKNHTFVGVVNNRYCLIQHQTKLYICNLVRLRETFFYQAVLTDFGNFAKFRFPEPLSVYELAIIALNLEDSGWTEGDGTKEELAVYICQFMKEKALMLDDYFSIEIDQEGRLATIPMLLDGYIPPVEGLPMFILRLSTEVKWDVEKDCFETFCKETARFYASESVDHVSTESGAELKRGGWKWITEHLLFPAMKKNFSPPKEIADDSSLLQIANLPDLYKVFERC